jgi:tetratricopeptide (TPR) repeat protein
MRKGSKKAKKASKMPGRGRAIPEGGRTGPASRASSRTLIIVAASVAIAAFVVFLPALQNDFLTTWDDNLYILDNPHIRSLDFSLLKWSFTDTTIMWVPLTKISHALVYALWGLNPAGHHLINILLHALNTFLVVVLIMSLFRHYYGVERKDFSFDQSKSLYLKAVVACSVTGLLFGLHPLRVESVVWVTERKDVLYSFFFLLSLIFYLKYTSVSLNKRRSLYYGICLLLFSFALLSKAMAVTLPAVLLILDVYPLRRFKVKARLKSQLKLLIDKLPFFCMSLIYTVVTISTYAERSKLRPVEKYPFAQRIYGSFHELVFYLYKMVFPANLVPYYPYREMSFLSPDVLGSSIAVVVITVFCIYSWRKNRQVYLAVWVYYIVTLLPVLGIIQVGKTAGADRYTYLASIGPFLLIGLVTATVYEKVSGLKQRLPILKTASVAAAIAALISLSYITIRQTAVWKNSLVFWSYVIEKEPGRVAGAYYNLGNAYYADGLLDKAIEQFETTLRIEPGYKGTHYKLGIIYQSKGLPDLAIQQYETALRLNPDDMEVHNNLGVAYQSKGLLDKATEQYQKALSLSPDNAQTHCNLGNTYLSEGLFDKAIQQYQTALRLKPDYEKAYKNMRVAYMRKGLKNETTGNEKQH